MTVISTANPSVDTASIVAEFGGQASQSVDIMIGVGLVKDSEAVYFQYVGDEQKVALMDNAGKPVSRIGNVRLTGLSIVDDIYADAGFSGSKLNIFLETQNGRSVMLTSGLSTIWSQCLMTCLMGLYRTGSLDHLIAIDTWKGTSMMKPCFAAVRDGLLRFLLPNTPKPLRFFLLKQDEPNRVMRVSVAKHPPIFLHQANVAFRVLLHK